MPTEPDDLAYSKRDLYERTPVGHARRTDTDAVKADELASIAASFSDPSVGERYLGPTWVNDDGIACVVFIAQSIVRSKRFAIANVAVPLLGDGITVRLLTFL